MKPLEFRLFDTGSLDTSDKLEGNLMLRQLNRILFIGMTIGCLSMNFTANAADEGTDSAAQALVKTDPCMHFALKNKAGQSFAMNKWSKDKLTVFMLTEKGKSIKTIVADSTIKSAAETSYALNGKTIMTYTSNINGADSKPAPLMGKMTIGSDEYEVVEAFTIVSDR